MAIIAVLDENTARDIALRHGRGERVRQIANNKEPQIFLLGKERDSIIIRAWRYHNFGEDF